MLSELQMSLLGVGQSLDVCTTAWIEHPSVRVWAKGHCDIDTRSGLS